RDWASDFWRIWHWPLGAWRFCAWLASVRRLRGRVVGGARRCGCGARRGQWSRRPGPARKRCNRPGVLRKQPFLPGNGACDLLRSMGGFDGIFPFDLAAICEKAPAPIQRTVAFHDFSHAFTTQRLLLYIHAPSPAMRKEKVPSQWLQLPEDQQSLRSIPDVSPTRQ